MDKMNLIKIDYKELNARQKEQYLFQKLSAVLADYGYGTIKLSDDWQGADFIAQSMNGQSFLKVQLKGRFTIDKKYLGKDLYIAFRLKSDWYVFPHDEIVTALEDRKIYTETVSWANSENYSVSEVANKEVLGLLEPYKLSA